MFLYIPTTTKLPINCCSMLAGFSAAIHQTPRNCFLWLMLPCVCWLSLCGLQVVGLVVSFIIIYNYLEEEDACKYLVNTSTYARPLGPLSTLPLTRARPPGSLSLEEGMGTYRPVAVRDSWCIPTYVSYHDSMEWSGSYSSEHPHPHHHHQQPPPPQQQHCSPDSDASLIGAGLNDRGRHSPSPGFESNGSVSSAATTQPYLRLSMTSSDQVET